ncbi:MAG TPA: toll/interleukin-1 receptor domain-containing protein [Anaerolineales bacterium]|nr:toll/interleukin-1 receptor domain-containing protein [Anaerolineales bacterium]
MKQIFISYSRKDIDFARKLTNSFIDQELDSWIDWDDIPPSVDWMMQIQKGIEETNVFLFLVSPDSLSSRVCRQEIEYAVKNGKRIIPIILRDIEMHQAYEPITHLNWIFFRDADPYENSLEKLVTAIHTDYDWVQTHRRLQVKALEWERNHQEDSFLLRGKDLQDAEAQLLVNGQKDPIATELQHQFISASRAAESVQIEAEQAREQQLRLEKSTGARMRRLSYVLLGIFTLAFFALFYWVYRSTTDLVLDAMRNELHAIIETGALSIDAQAFADLLKLAPSTEGTSQDPLFISHREVLQNIQAANPNAQVYTVAASPNPEEVYIVANAYGILSDLNDEFKYAYKVSDFNYDTLIGGMQETIVDMSIFTDQFGTWMSGCTPIKDAQENSLGALCADFEASFVYQAQSDATRTLKLAFLSIYPIVLILILSATQILQRVTSRFRKTGKEKAKP